MTPAKPERKREGTLTLKDAIDQLMAQSLPYEGLTGSGIPRKWKVVDL
jgi:hypothetical protein